MTGWRAGFAGRNDRLKQINKDMETLKSIRAELLDARRIVRVLEWKEKRAARKLGIET